MFVNGCLHRVNAALRDYSALVRYSTEREKRLQLATEMIEN